MCYGFCDRNFGVGSALLVLFMLADVDVVTARDLAGVGSVGRAHVAAGFRFYVGLD